MSLSIRSIIRSPFARIKGSGPGYEPSGRPITPVGAICAASHPVIRAVDRLEHPAPAAGTAVRSMFHQFRWPRVLSLIELLACTRDRDCYAGRSLVFSLACLRGSPARPLRSLCSALFAWCATGFVHVDWFLVDLAHSERGSLVPYVVAAEIQGASCMLTRTAVRSSPEETSRFGVVLMERAYVGSARTLERLGLGASRRVLRCSVSQLRWVRKSASRLSNVRAVHPLGLPVIPEAHSSPSRPLHV